MAASISLRPPTFSAAAASKDFQNPSIAWMTETWHVTHSTLPMWKSKRNVRIQYTPLPPSQPSIATDNSDKLDDLVTYQSLTGTKISSVKGVDTCSSSGDARGEWDWRGKGWLMIASSHWEVLGWGQEAETQNKWVVTVFAKTMFTPAGIDIYSLHRGGLKKETVEDIKEALLAVDDVEVKKMAGTLFEVTIDDARSD